MIANIKKLFRLFDVIVLPLCTAFFLVSCKPNMAAFIDEYNKMFVPSEDILWTVENIENSTQDFEHFELGGPYTVSKDAGLFIIGGPRDCDNYTWTLSGQGTLRPCGDQIFYIRIKNTKINLTTGATENNGSLTAGDYEIKLTCKKGTVVKEKTATLHVE